MESYKNKESQLIEILLFLNDLGVVFGEDYKLPMAPADYMRDLQKRAILQKPFKSIGWSGPGDFIIRRFASKGSRKNNSTRAPKDFRKVWKNSTKKAPSMDRQLILAVLLVHDGFTTFMLYFCFLDLFSVQ